MEHDTIAALSTPNGRGGIAVIRLSGSSSLAILKKSVVPIPKKIVPRMLEHGYVWVKGKRIDECLWTHFPEPRSFTGEEMAEISLHSNPFVVDEVLGHLCRSGARMALAGEFSYRAYRNGKIDLIQAEAINDLIAANSRAYAHMEFSSLQGALSRKMSAIRETLLDAAVRLETAIEFGEDQCLAEAEPRRDFVPVIKELEGILRLARFSEAFNRGIKVVIAGKVNVGKSTLFNALLQEERSIISSFPGTTRDFIREKLMVEGFLFEITDIAGFRRRAESQVESEGITRSRERMEEADAVLFLLDASGSLDAVDKRLYSLIRSKKKMVLLNKSDVAKPGAQAAAKRAFSRERIVSISAKRSQNLDAIFSFFKSLIADFPHEQDGMAVNRRQKELLANLLVSVRKTSALAKKSPSAIEMAAEEVRSALSLVGQLTGEITTDELLREIFGRFCIGK